MSGPARPLKLVSTVEPTDPLVGQLVDGRYRIEGVLGKGGMGLVYRARHQVLGKPLALKVLLPEVSRDGDVMERFKREAQAASAIGSPHICDVSDFGSLADGSTYFVMELLDGPSLTSVMKAGPMPTERIVAVAMQICEALGDAHARHIVHRDLKPDNVHLVPRGANPDFVKILDFGIAKVAGGADKKLTQAGQIFGTPHYMSPEQCAGREVDHRTDVYALGVMLYEMACGKVPFDADTLMGVLTKHVFEQPLAPHELGLVVHPGLEAVILKCLAKQPDDRYASMGALRADLEKIAQGATPSAVRDGIDRAIASAGPASPHIGPVVAVPAAPAVAAPPRGKALPIALAVVTLLAVGAGTFAFAFLRNSPAESDIESAERVAQSDRVTAPRDEAGRVAQRHEEPRREEPRREEPRREEPGREEQVVAEAREGSSTETTPVRAEPIRVLTEPVGALVLDASGVTLGSTPVELPRPAEGARVEYRVQLVGHREVALVVSAQTQREVSLRLVPERRGGGRRDVAGTDQPRADTTAEVPSGSVTPNADSSPSRDTGGARDGDLTMGDGLINPFGRPAPRQR
jgi:serine/threonine-protein kinase